MPSLKKLIDEQRAEFDALDFAGTSRSEAFHSKVLAWLLDPRGTHDAGEHFLRGFLLQATAQVVSARIGTDLLPANAAFDWSETKVHREWAHAVDGDKGYLDILLLNEEAGFLCAVENKIGSGEHGEHGEQLTRYRKALVNQYPDFDGHHVFLTPGGRADVVGSVSILPGIAVGGRAQEKQRQSGAERRWCVPGAILSHPEEEDRVRR